MNARKAIGGWLVRLGQRIARPTVAETRGCRDGVHVIGPAGRCPCGDAATGGGGIGGWSRDSAVYRGGPVGPAMQEHLQRCESRGWN